MKVRGFRVELGEVEGALRTVDGVRGAVADVVTADNGLRSLTAVVATGTDGPDGPAITAAVAQLLPSYMVPAPIHVVGELPLTSNGKLDRAAIAAMLASHAPVEDVVAPDDDLEAALADIVATVLAIDPAEISVTSDFFAIGGDSVLATTVIARIREWLDAPAVGIVDIFSARTVRELARRIAAADEPGRLHRVAAIYLEVSAMDETMIDSTLDDQLTESR